MTANVYSTGTVTVTAGSAIVTGSGTLWLTGTVNPGDIFHDAVTGLTEIVLSVQSNTQLTLTSAAPAAMAGAGRAYSIMSQAYMTTMRDIRNVVTQWRADAATIMASPAWSSLANTSVFSAGLLDNSNAATWRTDLGAISFADADLRYTRGDSQFTTVADLLADIKLSLTPGTGKTVVALGSIVTAQGFRYLTVTAPANVHVATAGGLLLQVLPDANGYSSLTAFGAPANGTGNATNALKKAIEVARAILIVGTFLIDGTVTVPSNTRIQGLGGTASELRLLDTAVPNAWGLKFLNATDSGVYGVTLNGRVQRLSAGYSLSGGPVACGIIFEGCTRCVAQGNRVFDWAKHGIDVSAPQYSSASADSWVTVGRSKNCAVIGNWVRYCGDDNITTHQSDDTFIHGNWSEDPSGLFVPNNTNCIEIDDGSRGAIVTNNYCKGGACGIQVKGHTGQPAPFGVIIANNTIDSCNAGIDAYNTDFYGNSGDVDGALFSKTAYSLIIHGNRVINPMVAIATSDTLPMAIRVRSYAGVSMIGNTVENASASVAYLDDALVHITGGVRGAQVRDTNFINCANFEAAIFTTNTVGDIQIDGVQATRCTGKSIGSVLVRLTVPDKVFVTRVDRKFCTNVGVVGSAGVVSGVVFSEGSNVPHRMQTEARSVSGAGATPSVTISHGWVEGGQDLGPDEGIAWDMTAQRVTDTTSQTVARIETRKSNGTDTDLRHLWRLLLHDGSNLVERMRVDPTTGFVGFGTSSAGARVHVAETNAFSLGGRFETTSAETSLLSHPVMLFHNSNSTVGNGLNLRFQIADTSGTMRLAGGIGAVATAKTSTTITPDLYIYVNATERLRLQNDGAVVPGSDNGQTSGSPSRRWSGMFTVNAPTVGSDARIKTNVRDLKEAELQAGIELAENVKVFQYIEAVAAKGDEARLHPGMIAQEVEAILIKHGLNPWAYGMLCRDPVTKPVTRTVKRMVPVMNAETVVEPVIEVIDGKPVQVMRERVIETPVTDLLPVTDETGTPVMQLARTGEYLPGNPPIPEMRAVPVMHPVPRMTEREVEETFEEPDGELWSLRYEPLAMFCIRAMASKLTNRKPK